MINIKNFDSSLLKIDNILYKNIGIYYIGYITKKKELAIMKKLTLFRGDEVNFPHPLLFLQQNLSTFISSVEILLLLIFIYFTHKISIKNISLNRSYECFVTATYNIL